jgi:hypothetical protein
MALRQVGLRASFFGPKQDLTPQLRCAVDRKAVGKYSLQILLRTLGLQNSFY